MAYREALSAGRARETSDEIVVEVGTTFWRNIAKWTVGFLFFSALTALLVSLSLFQVTAEGSAKRTLRRAVAALSEVDPLLDRNYNELRERAQAAPADGTVRLRDFPIDIPLTRDDVLGSSKERLRDVLLDRSADVMYARGSSVLRAPDTTGQDIGVFSVAGLTDNGLDFLRRRNHEVLGALTYALAALCVALGVTLAALCRGFGRLASVGAAVLLAAVPLLVSGIGARFYMRIVSQDDTEYVQREFLQIGQGLAWIPIRDGLAFTVLGAAFLAAGWGCALWADRQARR